MDPHWFQCWSGSNYFRSMRIRVQIRIQGFDSIIKSQNFPRPTWRDVQATGQAFRKKALKRKRTSSTSKHEVSSLCSYFVGHYCLLEPDPQHFVPALWIRMELMQIRIRTRIRIFSNCGFGSESRSQCGSGHSYRSSVLMTKNWKNLLLEFFFYFFDQKFQFTYP